MYLVLGTDWKNIEQTALSVIDKKWISNEKQKNKTSHEPHGHNVEAVAHFKEYADKRDPYYVYTINDRRGNPEKPSLVFKSSSLFWRYFNEVLRKVSGSNDYVQSTWLDN